MSIIRLSTPMLPMCVILFWLGIGPTTSPQDSIKAPLLWKSAALDASTSKLFCSIR
jgi:hypothetical protein